MTADALVAAWPLFGLQLGTPNLVLRPPTDDDFPGLFDAIDAGIHDPKQMPFSQPWTDAEPGARRRSAAQFWWRARADWTPDSWHCLFGVWLDGRPIGVQELYSKRFRLLRQVGTGSWLTRSAQGRGLGKQMRAAVLHLAFEHLSAAVAYTEAFADNPSSLGVTQALGYEENGRQLEAPRGEPRELLSFRLTRQRWPASPAAQVPVEVHGLAPCLELFGAQPTSNGSTDEIGSRSTAAATRS